MRLMLGEGPYSKPEPDKIRVDIVPKWADVVWDLNDGLPKLEGKFSYIEASHVFEHIESSKVLKQIIKDIYDLLENKGVFLIEVPYWHSESAVECIEHCHFFNENSFMNFYSNPFAEEMGMPQFKLVSNGVIDKVVRVVLTK
jgi:predicted SAM-dependent methyltransferase